MLQNQGQKDCRARGTQTSARKDIEKQRFLPVRMKANIALQHTLSQKSRTLVHKVEALSEISLLKWRLKGFLAGMKLMF